MPPSLTELWFGQSIALAMACLVSKDRCEMTNLSWVIDGVALTQKYGIECAKVVRPAPYSQCSPLRQLMQGGACLWLWYIRNGRNTQLRAVCRVAVLNDFEANGYGILALQPEDVVVLHDAPPVPKVCPTIQLARARTATHDDGDQAWTSVMVAWVMTAMKLMAPMTCPCMSMLVSPDGPPGLPVPACHMLLMERVLQSSQLISRAISPQTPQLATHALIANMMQQRLSSMQTCPQ